MSTAMLLPGFRRPAAAAIRPMLAAATAAKAPTATIISRVTSSAASIFPATAAAAAPTTASGTVAPVAESSTSKPLSWCCKESFEPPANHASCHWMETGRGCLGRVPAARFRSVSTCCPALASSMSREATARPRIPVTQTGGEIVRWRVVVAGRRSMPPLSTDLIRHPRFRRAAASSAVVPRPGPMPGRGRSTHSPPLASTATCGSITAAS